MMLALMTQMALPAPRKPVLTRLQGWALFLLIFGTPIIGLIAFIVGVFNPNETLDSAGFTDKSVPWWGILGLAAFAIPLLLLPFLGMWAKMVARFSPKPFSRFLFACFTLMLMCTGIGWFALFFIYLWVMDSKPDLFTGEPLARGPKRDAWLAQRKPQTIHTQAVNIDARQVHYHEW